MSKLYIEGDYITVEVIYTPYIKKTVKSKVKNEEGKTVSISEEIEVPGKSILIPKTCRLDCISSIDDYINDKNKVSDTKCVIFDKYSGREFLVNHSRIEILNSLLLKANNKIGFYGSKI